MEAKIEYTVDIDGILSVLGYPQNPNSPDIEGQTFVAPLSSRGSQKLKLKPVPASASKSLPPLLDWRLVKDQSTGNSIIRGAGTQYGCGCCYLIGILSMLEDRITIKSNKNAPYLSYTFVLSCNTGTSGVGINASPGTSSTEGTGTSSTEDVGINANGSTPTNNIIVSNGCMGGNPAEAANFIADNGTVDYVCSDFSFCIFNPGCAQGTNSSSQNNALIPSCKNQEKCQTCYQDQCIDTSNLVFRELFYIDKTSIRSLPTITSIQQDILSNGPCAATFRVPLDFILGGIDKSKYPKATQWSQTNGIYVNLQGVDMYDMGMYPDSTSSSLVSDTFMGNHTVVIVGWGETILSYEKINQGQPTKIRYWIVRNSWSSAWNAPMSGFFNIAMTTKTNTRSNGSAGVNADRSNGSAGGTINDRLHLDTETSIDGIQFGGGISVLPSTETLKRVQNQPRHQKLVFDKNTNIPKAVGSIEITSAFHPLSALNSNTSPSTNSSFPVQPDSSSSETSTKAPVWPWYLIGVSGIIVLALTAIIIWLALKPKNSKKDLLQTTSIYEV